MLSHQAVNVLRFKGVKEDEMGQTTTGAFGDDEEDLCTLMQMSLLRMGNAYATSPTVWKMLKNALPIINMMPV